MEFSKRTAQGREERRRLLGLAQVPKVPRGARLDDFYDALALARWTGRRFGGQELDARGLRMEIWC